MDPHGLSTFEFIGSTVGSALVVDQAVFDLIRGCNTFVERKRFFRRFALRICCEVFCITSPVVCFSLESTLHCLVVHVNCVSSRSVCVSASWVGEVTYDVEKKTHLID